MGIETIIVIAMVGLAATYLARQSMRSANGRGCAGGCGACTNKQCTNKPWSICYSYSCYVI